MDPDFRVTIFHKISLRVFDISLYGFEISLRVYHSENDIKKFYGLYFYKYLYFW